MTEEEFFADYDEGRRDFQNECLQGLDFFTPIIRKSHSELFDDDIATLAFNKAPVISRPIAGLSFPKGSLHRAKLLDSDLLRSILVETDISQTDARLATFSGADLTGAKLTGADLRFATFIGTTLNNADLRDAKLDHSTIRYATLDKANLEGTSGIGLELSKSRLCGANLKNAKFNRSLLNMSDMSSSTLDGACFRDAVLWRTKANSISSIGCDFTNANATFFDAADSNFENSGFQNADLSNAVLSCASFVRARLTNAKLSSADLRYSRFHGATLQGANLHEALIANSEFKGVTLGGTVLTGIDLSEFINSKLRHTGPSTIDHASIAMTISRDPIHPLDFHASIRLQEFCEACGTPPVVAVYLIDSIRSLQSGQLRRLMSSTFISYGTPDEEFANKLNKDLLKNSVTTFFFPLDAPFGEKLHATMRRVDSYDRIILICSERSLNRTGLQYELEKTIEREARDGGESYLIPVSLDDYLFNRWKPRREHLREEVVSRVVADFSDDKNYRMQFQRLLRVLKKLDS